MLIQFNHRCYIVKLGVKMGIYIFFAFLFLNRRLCGVVGWCDGAGLTSSARDSH